MNVGIVPLNGTDKKYIAKNIQNAVEGAELVLPIQIVLCSLQTTQVAGIRSFHCFKKKITAHIAGPQIVTHGAPSSPYCPMNF